MDDSRLSLLNGNRFRRTAKDTGKEAHDGEWTGGDHCEVGERSAGSEGWGSKGRAEKDDRKLERREVT
jgi:hypothetical protein